MRKVYRHAWTIVDVASRFKAAEPLTLEKKNPNKGTCKRIMVSLKFDWFDLAYPTENEDAANKKYVDNEK